MFDDEGNPLTTPVYHNPGDDAFPANLPPNPLAPSILDWVSPPCYTRYDVYQKIAVELQEYNPSVRNTNVELSNLAVRF